MKAKRTLYVKLLKAKVILLVASFLLLPLVTTAQEGVTNTYVFEQGLNGYFGVIDTTIVDSPVGVGSWGTFYPDSPADDAPLLLSGTNRQTLIQFQDIFGSMPGQIPFGSTIKSATLEFGTRNTWPWGTHSLYMMIVSWNGSITWNSAVDGIQIDGTEASSSAVDSIYPMDGGLFDVTSSVSDWINGTTNNGWILTGTTQGDDWTMFSSESLTAPGTDPLDQGPIPRLIITVEGPVDSDGDGIPDDQDLCPNEDATGFDTDEDGCIDSLTGLNDMLEKLVDEGIIADELKNSLLSKVANAEKSADKENIDAAIAKLQALINEINAQTGKKISEKAALEIIEYTDSIINWLMTQLT